MQPEFATIPFQDEAKAEGNLKQVEALLPSSLHQPLASLLAHSPDPDRALNLLERYAHAAPREELVEAWIAYKLGNQVQAGNPRPHPSESALYYDI